MEFVSGMLFYVERNSLVKSITASGLIPTVERKRNQPIMLFEIVKSFFMSLPPPDTAFPMGKLILARVV